MFLSKYIDSDQYVTVNVLKSTGMSRVGIASYDSRRHVNFVAIQIRK